MPSSQLPQEDDVQLHVDHSPVEDGDVQPAAPNSARMANLLAKVPKLSLLATAFFAATPIITPDTLGGTKHA